jgi:DNA-binding beta-propeller fold protein YncE
VVNTNPASGAGSDAGVAYNPVNGYAYYSVPATNSVLVVNPANGQIVTTIQLAHGADPQGIAVAPSGTTNAGDIYVVDGGTGYVSVISPDTNQVIHTIDLGTSQNTGLGIVSQQIAIAPSGTPNAGDVYVVNTATTSSDSGYISEIGTNNAVIGTLANGDISSASSGSIVVNPANGDVYIANGTNVAVIDPTTHTVTEVAVPQESTYVQESTALVAAPSGSTESGDVYVFNTDGSNDSQWVATMTETNQITNTALTASNGSPVFNDTPPAGAAINPTSPQDAFVAEGQTIGEYNVTTGAQVGGWVDLDATQPNYIAAGDFVPPSTG